MDVEIDTATMDDADAIADLWVELARGQRAYDSHILPEENRTSVRESVARHVVAGRALVARVAVDGEAGAETSERSDETGTDHTGDLAGFVTFGPETEGFETDCERGTVENIYVRPAHRDEGVGGALLDAAEDELCANGADAITLEVMAGNVEARRFYERRGYEPHRVELEKRAESDTDSKEDR